MSLEEGQGELNLQRIELEDIAAIEIIRDLEWKRGKFSKVIQKTKVNKSWKLVVYKEEISQDKSMLTFLSAP